MAANRSFDEVILKKRLEAAKLSFSIVLQRNDNRNAKALNTANTQLWERLSEDTKSKVAETHVYGKDTHFDPQNALTKFNETLHLSNLLDSLSKTQVENSVLDCVNRVVIQPHPFVDTTPISPSSSSTTASIIPNLMQGTVASPAFIEFESNSRPGGEFFLKQWCNPPVKNLSTSKNEYSLSEVGEKKLAEHIFQLALLYFRALDDNQCTTCVIPDVGCGAYLKDIAISSKENTQQIIRTAWQEAAKTQTFAHLKTFIFTYRDPVSPTHAINNSADALIVYAAGKDNLAIAKDLAENFPKEKVAVTIAGGVQGMGGDFLSTRGIGSQEEAVYRNFGNMSGPMVAEGLRLTEASLKSRVIPVNADVPQFTMASVNPELAAPIPSITINNTQASVLTSASMASSATPVALAPSSANDNGPAPSLESKAPPTQPVPPANVPSHPDHNPVTSNPSQSTSADIDVPLAPPVAPILPSNQGNPAPVNQLNARWDDNTNITKILNTLALNFTESNWDNSSPSASGTVISDQHSRSFTIASSSMTTNGADLQTFKAMLLSFQALKPQETPSVKVGDANIARLWQQAATELGINAEIKLTTANTNPSPPSNSSSPRPQ